MVLFQGLLMDTLCFIHPVYLLSGRALYQAKAFKSCAQGIRAAAPVDQYRLSPRALVADENQGVHRLDQAGAKGLEAVTSITRR